MKFNPYAGPLTYSTFSIRDEESHKRCGTHHFWNRDNDIRSQSPPRGRGLETVCGSLSSTEEIVRSHTGKNTSNRFRLYPMCDRCTDIVSRPGREPVSPA